MSSNPPHKTAMPAFVIGLADHKSHYERTIRDLSTAGVTAELWQGVDGNLVKKLASGERISSWWFRLMKGLSPKSLPGVVGCYLSHYRLLRHIYEQGHARAVVFEDDIIPFPALAKTLARIENLPAKYEVIQLWSQRGPQLAGSHITTDCGPLTESGNLFHTFAGGFGAVAYVITREAIAKLLPHMMPLTKEVDSFLFMQPGPALFRAPEPVINYFFVSPNPLMTDPEKASSINLRLPLRLRLEMTFLKLLLLPLRLVYIRYHIWQRNRYIKSQRRGLFGL